MKSTLSQRELAKIAIQLNHLDYALNASRDLNPELQNVIDSINPNQYLIVYGSLAPGQPNHHELQHIEGIWHEGQIRGHVKQLGWGANLGYPGLIWDPNGSDVVAHILQSKHLAQHWDNLDQFEGAEYKRIFIPFSTSKGLSALGHVYSLK